VKNNKIKNFLSFVLIIISNIVYTDFLFYLVEKKDYSIAIKGLEQVSQDFESIGLTSSLSYLRFSTFIGIFIGLLTFVVLFRKSKELDAKEALVKLINLFFINTSVLIFSIYIFRFFNFSRLYLIINLILYPIIFFVILSLLSHTINSTSKFYTASIAILIVACVAGYSINNESRVVLNIQNVLSSEESSESSSNLLNSGIEKEDLNQQITGSLDCFKWSGSNNFVSCLEGFEITQVQSFNPEYINNFVSFEKELYTVFKSGKILLNNSFLFLDISTKINNTAVESGLYDIAFHPTENYFLISYANSNNNLVIEKFISTPDITHRDGEIIFYSPNNSQNHYCGSLEWSNYFNTFLLCVGDGGQPNDSINTTSYRGKIFTLDNNIISNPSLISETNIQQPIRNLIGYGLRNPWNFIEHEGNLIIPDVGDKSNEELNIVNLDELSNAKKSFLFGWPIYEGSILNEEVYYDLNIWNTEYKDVYSFVQENSIDPVVFYDRPAPENNRTAILGTLIINNENNRFHNHVVFADFLSKEIFFYDYKKDELYILNLPSFPGVLTAIGNHESDNSKIIFTTSDGESTNVYHLNLQKFNY
jgi:hypothetical protein